MHSERRTHVNFTPAEHANFLGAKVVAAASAFLEGRHDIEALQRNVDGLWCEIIAAPDDDVAAKLILTPARLLLVAMTGAVRSPTETRRERWADVMQALAGLVRNECREIKRGSSTSGALPQ